MEFIYKVAIFEVLLGVALGIPVLVEGIRGFLERKPREGVSQ